MDKPVSSAVQTWPFSRWWLPLRWKVQKASVVGVNAITGGQRVNNIINFIAKYVKLLIWQDKCRKAADSVRLTIIAIELWWSYRPYNWVVMVLQRPYCKTRISHRLHHVWMEYVLAKRARCHSGSNLAALASTYWSSAYVIASNDTDFECQWYFYVRLCECIIIKSEPESTE
jgi:hypothetical protein